MIATLPHYTGGPRRANGELYAQPAALTLAQLQARVREFIDAYNTERRHSSLGMTPAEKWASSAAPIDVVPAERLRWMLLADQTRKMDKDGIHFENAIFVAPELNEVGRGTEVEVRYMPHDRRWIEVFTRDGWLCTAYPQDRLSEEQAGAVVAQRYEAAREMGRRKAAASRKARARIAPLTATGTVQDITAVVGERDRRGERETSRRDAESSELLAMLGLAEQLNKPLPASAGERRILGRRL